MKTKLERIEHIANVIAKAIQNDSPKKKLALAGLNEIQSHASDMLAELEDRIVFVPEEQREPPIVSKSEGKCDQCLRWLQTAIPRQGKNSEDVIAEGIALGFGRSMIYAAFNSLQGTSRRVLSAGKFKAKWCLGESEKSSPPKPKKRLNFRSHKDRKILYQACDYYIESGESKERCALKFGLAKSSLSAEIAIKYLKRKGHKKTKPEIVKPGCVYEIDGLLTARGVAVKMGVSKACVSGLWEKSKQGRNMFPLPVDKRTIPNSSFPRNVWKPEDIDAYLELTYKEVPF